MKKFKVTLRIQGVVTEVVEAEDEVEAETKVLVSTPHIVLDVVDIEEVDGKVDREENL